MKLLNEEPELKMALSRSNRLCGDPGQEKTWITAIGETDQGMSREGDLKLAVTSEDGVGVGTGVGEGGLHQNPGHEGQSSGRLSWLCLDLEGLPDQRRPRSTGSRS